jgi:flagellar biosynthesis/type III secretory pathway chaperone
MASMMENLVGVLQEELDTYKEFIPILQEKKVSIIKNKVEDLQNISNVEQEYLDKINNLENKREEIVKNMAIVFDKDYKQLNIKAIIKMLDNQPKDQQVLSKLHDELISTVKTVMGITEHNKSLIEQSLEMIEFNMNVIRSTWMSPGSNNYDKGAQVNEVMYSNIGTKSFDAKQ